MVIEHHAAGSVDSADVFGHVVAGERLAGHGHHARRRADAPNVALRVVTVRSGDHFWGHIAHGPHLRVHPLAGLEIPSQAEVNEPQVSARLGPHQKVILRLDIPVRQLVIVQIRDAFQHLPEVLYSLAGRQAAHGLPAGAAVPQCRAHPLEEIAALAKVHHQMVGLPILECVVQRDDVRVLQPPCDAQLPLEHGRVLDFPHGDRLQGENLAGVLLLHPGNHAETPRAQHLHDIVRVPDIVGPTGHGLLRPEAVVRVDGRGQPL
mmetsp:Transcript_47080/g.143019  ORF Transcript_47080/g.143019 Transcript_47080/m.143019 type:complete len:263 (-) Transcript_47080:47-835(-)|eukprot:CAMPEP_0198492918 /NCGR_PEP_ID=MMETSP1462-20131121/3697_1 /TAXON_ID=1333877 /ORGANISM="Brandtodinium nutriculum, Strain RCC3387" /LENGTH=262 /DNA_ID=CAMNT_0044221579 /DNA_START=276 /DNA_END=1064 /DNA_ORIENTATION=+